MIAASDDRIDEEEEDDAPAGVDVVVEEEEEEEVEEEEVGDTEELTVVGAVVAERSGLLVVCVPAFVAPEPDDTALIVTSFDHRHCAHGVQGSSLSLRSSFSFLLSRAADRWIFANREQE